MCVLGWSRLSAGFQDGGRLGAVEVLVLGHTNRAVTIGAQPGCPSFRVDTSEVEEQIRFVLENNVEIRLQLCFDVILFHTAACTSINAMVWLT